MIHSGAGVPPTTIHHSLFIYFGGFFAMLRMTTLKIATLK